MNQSAANGKKNFDLDILRSLGIFIVSLLFCLYTAFSGMDCGRKVRPVFSAPTC